MLPNPRPASIPGLFQFPPSPESHLVPCYDDHPPLSSSARFPVGTPSSAMRHNQPTPFHHHQLIGVQHYRDRRTSVLFASSSSSFLSSSSSSSLPDVSSPCYASTHAIESDEAPSRAAPTPQTARVPTSSYAPSPSSPPPPAPAPAPAAVAASYPASGHAQPRPYVQVSVPHLLADLII